MYTSKNFKLFMFTVITVIAGFYSAIKQSFIGPLVYIFSIGIITYFNHKKKEELKEMWLLADQTNISIEELSKLTGLGKLDLVSSRNVLKNKYFYDGLTFKQIITTTSYLQGILAERKIESE